MPNRRAVNRFAGAILLKNHRALSYLLLRIALGMNFFGHGFFRILSGVGAFAAGTAQGMAKGPLHAGERGARALAVAFFASPIAAEVTDLLLLLLGNAHQ